MEVESSSGSWKVECSPERLRLERTPRSQVLRVDENFSVERTPGRGALSGCENPEPLPGKPSKSGPRRRARDTPAGVVSSKAVRRSTRQLFAFAPQSTPVSNVRRLGCEDKVNDDSSSETELSSIGTGSAGSFLVPRQNHLVLTDSHEELSFSVAENNSVCGNRLKECEEPFVAVEEEEVIGDYEPVPAEERPSLPVEQSAETRGKGEGGKGKGGKGKKRKGSTVKRLAGEVSSPFIELSAVEHQREQGQLERQKMLVSELAERSEISESNSTQGSPSLRVHAETDHCVPMSVPSDQTRGSRAGRGFVPPVVTDSDSSDSWSPPRGPFTRQELVESLKKHREARRLKSRGCPSKPESKPGKLLKKRGRNLPRNDETDTDQRPYSFDGVQRRLKNKISYSPVYTVSGSTPPGYSTPTGGETDPDMDFLGDD